MHYKFNLVSTRIGNTGKIKEVNQIFESFAHICYTKGNFVLLPSRKMNIERGCKGNKIEDRIDLTIYECFGNGKLAKFFKSESELRNWIGQEKLSSIFKNGEICRESIDWFVENQKPISEMDKDEICKYVDRAVFLICIRNK